MKRIAISLVVLFVTFAVAGAQVRYRGSIELDLGSGISRDFEGEPYGEQHAIMPVTVHGIEINERWTVGIGVGIGPSMLYTQEIGEITFSPVISYFLHVDYAFLKEHKWRPYVAARLGSLVSNAGSSVTFLIPAVGAGVRLNNRWNFGMMYRNCRVLELAANNWHIVSLQVAWRF